MPHLPSFGLALMTLTLAGCGEKSNTGTDSGTQAMGDMGEDTTWDDAPAYSGGACPLFRSGTNDSFMSSGTARSFELLLPPNPEGAPVVFAWHWLGGSASQIVDFMGFEALAASENVIIVAPESDGSPYEWHIADLPASNPDLTFFDDVVACLYDQYQIDENHIHATGMSAGGLWTTYLTVYRSELLASTAPLSGGVNTAQYVSPTRALPVMVVWGGPSDTYGTLSFDTTSRDFSSALQSDGSFVVECMHTAGHVIPAAAAEYTWQFFKDHPYGVDPLPYVDGLPESMPSYCYLPE
jgi:poly(3-hydroxybutyrate) depolymerase